jgi:hypothetical protein
VAVRKPRYARVAAPAVQDGQHKRRYINSAQRYGFQRKKNIKIAATVLFDERVPLGYESSDNSIF